MLGQVLDAFQSRMTGLLGRCTCRALADSSQLAAQMAKEPSAPQVCPVCLQHTLCGLMNPHWAMSRLELCKTVKACCHHSPKGYSAKGVLLV